LDWLQLKVHHRVVHVIAEAGYGKTTLLADFSRRTRLRMLWYRLDAQDRSWVAFLSYLVAAGRVQDEAFAPATGDLLRELGTGGPSMDPVLETFIRELQPLGEAGAVVVLDDFHAVDDAPDVRHIIRALLQHAPERVSFVLASRREPGLPVARLRALGEVAELHTDDLRFSEEETERLFRDTYGRPLEPDVLTDLSQRTEGWAASLQLVHSAIQARSAGEIRSFVRSLSGADGDLHDYLAEEVVGTLPDDLQGFLMRVALLQELEPSLMETASGRTASDVGRLALEGERCGLLVRGPDRHTSNRGIHPLVRQFLRHRLEREMGADGVRSLHLAIAREHYERWTVACHHFAEAGEPAEVHRCLEASVRAILGAGPFQLAASYIRDFPPTAWTAPLAMIQSRAEYQADHHTAAVRLAEQAFEIDRSALTAQNLSAVHTLTGDLGKAVEALEHVPRATGDPILRDIMAASGDVLQISLRGDIGDFVDRVEQMAERQRTAGLCHYEGISLLNGAASLRAQGHASRALQFSTRAVEALIKSGSARERIVAEVASTWALAHLGEATQFEAAYEDVLRALETRIQADALSELASIDVWYGDGRRAKEILDLASQTVHGNADHGEFTRLARLELLARQGNVREAQDVAAGMTLGVLSTESAHLAHQLAVNANLAVQLRNPNAPALITEVIALARSQRAWFWVRYCEVLRAFSMQEERVTIPASVVEEPVYLSILAEFVASALDRVGPADIDIIATEARLRPTRWRSALRTTAALTRASARWRASQLLDDIGQPSDVPLLREVANSAKSGSAYRSLGRRLSRKLADVVKVEDQGRIAVIIGGTRHEGTSIRRKVLALLCYLLTRSSFSATRDEALEALWPGLEPVVAVNSLNQTVYFLRRVIEPGYSEKTSPGFVNLDSNVIWLDADLIRSRSADCWRIIRGTGDRLGPAEIESLAQTYHGRFAMDFAYEEWAISYREALHAAYLQVLENAIAADTGSGHFDRGISLARRGLLVDPAADNLEASLIRLYKMSGAHAAAAEQYGHYAAVLRHELGIDPPTIEAV